MPGRLKMCSLPRITSVLALLLVSTGAPSVAIAQTLPDLVTPDVLRVCGDPGNMPFSDRKEAGFENKIANIIGDELKVKVRYYWLTQGPGLRAKYARNGFVRSDHWNELRLGRCPEHQSLLSVDLYAHHASRRPRWGFKADDPKLKDKSIGVIAGTPPVSRMGEIGLIGKMRTYAPYQLDPARKHQTVSAEIVSDLAGKTLDAAVLWGPAAGWLASQSGVEMNVVPLLDEPDRPPLSFRIGMGVRLEENDWKRSLNTVLRKRRADIEAVLREFHVPLMADEGNTLMEPAKP